MQRVLHLLIDYSQNAFVPGRNISDTILLAQELLAGYNQAKLPPRCTIKIDLQKAYDSVEWDFLIEADLPSIQVIKDSLQEFAALSGLQVNPNKSQIILSRAGQQVFILPKGVIKILEAKMRKFLWQGSTGRGYAKVAWEQGPNVTGLPIDTLLSRVMRHGQWNWPTSTDPDFNELALNYRDLRKQA
ncbi:UNVERIFIED_CONTAM: hypothetical protein Scaly_2887100 [Sesamum calycinum]|uniref:Reverse transcriptase domain-containing protein n=1 Tax=Sesamum calycinum TaxID=2727403 RepID=A0AAW2L6Z3_9LAMI